MIRVVVFVTKVLIVTVTALFFSSCGIDVNFKNVDGNGKVVTKSRTIEKEFKSVSAAQGLDVVIEQAESASVTIEADENLHNHIKTEVKNGELQISSDANIRNAASKRILVRLPVVEGISASSGASVKGSSTLKGDDLNLETSSSGDITVTIDAKDLSCDASSGSKIKVQGTAGTLNAECSSGSTINAKVLAAKDVTCDSSSGGRIFINATESLTAEASSGSKIYYVSMPAKFEKSTSSGGDVRQE